MSGLIRWVQRESAQPITKKRRNMPVREQPQLYTPTHKGLRSRLFRTSMKAGTTDWSDEASFNAFCDEFVSLVANIRHHHALEGKFYHPLLAARVPGGAEKLDEEHHIVDHQLDNLVAHLDGMKGQSAGFEKRRESGLEFYLAFNRFIAFFINHIDDEEEHVQRTLWDLCTGEELATAQTTLIASQAAEQVVENLEMMVAASNLDDLTDLYTGIKASVPPQIFENVACKLAERILSADDWSKLKSRLGIG
jgi:hemerythrin-like domain-containing protein